VAQSIPARWLKIHHPNAFIVRFLLSATMLKQAKDKKAVILSCDEVSAPVRFYSM